MSLEHGFRLSQYLTLGLSCAALVFAEVPFLPELQLCLAPVLALLLLAWWVEGRWNLPNRGADLLGLLIAAGGVIWLVTQLSDDDFVLAHLPWHLAILPYMGPLAMATLLVKVFRLRDTHHFWHLQGWGLLQIGMGCLLDGGPAFGAMMTAYLACDLVCLALHYRLSVSRQPSTAGSCPLAVKDENGRQLTESGKWLFAFTLRWTLLISPTALLLFLLTPRRDNWSWEPLNRIHTGYRRGNLPGGIEEMNLNNTGRIEVDDEVALHFSAVDAAGQPKTDVTGEQRFRGHVLDWYEHGRWTTMHLMPARPRSRGQFELPDLGPGQFFLTFTVQPRRAGGLVLAEPICFGSRSARIPVIALDKDTRRRLFAEFSGTVVPQVPSDQGREYRYLQVVPGQGDPGRFPARGLGFGRDMPLLQTLPPALRTPLHDWTVDLLRRLIQRRRYLLPEDVRAALAKAPQDYLVQPQHREAVANALTDYLANSGEYSYTLEIKRYDRLLDPVLDFLVNVKEGHCERYAAALALMLRSVAIPSRIVKGFRGCDNEGQGQYVVRHSHAHAWVEILVPSGWNSYDWLTLDATPPAPPASEPSSSLAYLWEEAGKFCMQWWRSLIVEYDGDEQAGLWDMLISLRPLSRLVILGLATSLCGIVFALWRGSASAQPSTSPAASTWGAGLALWRFLRRLRRSRQATADCGDAAIYPRLLRILARNVALRPRFAQTPREFGMAAQTFLQTRPAFAALAELPRRVVELFYRVRFGGHSLHEGERQQIETELDRFAEALNPFNWEPIHRSARNDESAQS
jgi:transglutaminase-like putative cysteine protease